MEPAFKGICPCIRPVVYRSRRVMVSESGQPTYPNLASFNANVEWPLPSNRPKEFHETPAVHILDTHLHTDSGGDVRRFCVRPISAQPARKARGLGWPPPSRELHGKRQSHRRCGKWIRRPFF